MTKKVRVSPAQFDWLEKYKNEEAIDYAIDIQPLNKRPDSPLHDWSASKVAKALYKGYEVEPQYKVGDWIYSINSRAVGKVVRVGNDFVEIDNAEGATFNYIRHATPEEIQAEKDRRKWAEIEEGDVVRKVPMAYEIAVYQGEADDETILVKNDSGQHLWRKNQVGLYAKKAGASNA